MNEPDAARVYCAIKSLREKACGDFLYYLFIEVVNTKSKSTSLGRSGFCIIQIKCREILI